MYKVSFTLYGVQSIYIEEYIDISDAMRARDQMLEHGLKNVRVTWSGKGNLRRA
ncbi:MAG: hypothetical protein LBQ27_00490 [Clostridiales bacterium]|jgi:hypothetical protein|nr:hypothetical protein [Clostridiales bacterium]